MIININDVDNEVTTEEEVDALEISDESKEKFKEIIRSETSSTGHWLSQ